MELKDKTVLFLGSSVTYGSASGGVSFADLMVKECGIKMIKEAVSGTTLAEIDDKSYVSRLKKIDKNTKIDLFICQLSTNDATKKIDLKIIEQSIKFIIEYVKEIFTCPIVFYTGTYYKDQHYEQMVQLIKKMQKEYDFYLLDLYNDPEMLAVSKEDYNKYMQDFIHPNIVGYKEWWLPKFIEFCKRI